MKFLCVNWMRSLLLMPSKILGNDDSESAQFQFHLLNFIHRRIRTLIARWIVLKRMKFLNMELRITCSVAIYFLNEGLQLECPFKRHNFNCKPVCLLCTMDICLVLAILMEDLPIYWHMLDKPFAVLHCTFLWNYKLRTFLIFCHSQTV